MAHEKRKKLFVDAEVQRSLILRVILYWLACVAMLELLQVAWVVATGPEQPTFLAYLTNHNWQAIGIEMLVATVVLVPIVWDALCFSNRFAGPIHRVRRVLQEVAQSGEAQQVHFRNGDYWHGFADDLNAALQRLASSNRSAPIAADEPIGAPADDDFSVVR